MRDVYIIGVGMTPFGKHMDKNMKTLAAEAVNASLQHAGLTKEAIQTAVVGNAYQGIVTGQGVVTAGGASATAAGNAGGAKGLTTAGDAGGGAGNGKALGHTK